MLVSNGTVVRLGIGFHSIACLLTDAGFLDPWFSGAIDAWKYEWVKEGEKELPECLWGGRFEGKNPSPIEASTSTRLSSYSGTPTKIR